MDKPQDNFGAAMNIPAGISEPKPSELARITELLKVEFRTRQYADILRAGRTPMQVELDELWHDYCHANKIEL